MKAVEVKNVSFSFGDNTILENVSMGLEEGDFVGLVGPNGSGKTTLAKNILGLLEPDSGSIEVYGRSPKKAQKEGLIGYVPQHYKRDHHFPATVEELLRISLMFDGVNQSYELLEELGIKNHLTEKFESLSGGQQQKVVTALSLLKDPEILVLDEPSVGVDIKSQKAFYSYLDRIREDRGITILMISHDIGAISRHTDEAIYLNKSVCCQADTKELPGILEETYGDDFRHYSHGGHDHD